MEPTQLNAFSNETIDHISPLTLDECLLKRRQGHTNLVRYIYEHARNKNIKIGIDGKVFVYDGTSFQNHDATTIYDSIISKTHTILSNHLTGFQAYYDVDNKMKDDIAEYLDHTENHIGVRLLLRQTIDKILKRMFAV